MSERFESVTPSSAAFPPRELWLHDPIKEGKLDVIYDPHGLKLVDMDATLELLLSTIETKESGYQFISTYADVHHGEHDEADYPYLPDEEINPRQFRTLACNQFVLGRVPHAWWHRVFNKPELATKEGMKLRLDAQLPITRVFHSVKYANQQSHNRNGEFNHRVFYRQLHERMGFYSRMLDELRSVPEEFQIVPAEALEYEKADDIIQIARMFKHYARPKAPMPIVLLGDERRSEIALKA